jgi:formylglycine-generating enzyme required for sulfatase activity
VFVAVTVLLLLVMMKAEPWFRNTHQKATATKVSNDANSLGGMQFVSISPGEFMMGADSENDSDDTRPVHQVIFAKGFDIQTTEVTEKQWKLVMRTAPPYFSKCDDCPVDGVSWNEAQEFVKRMNDRKDGHIYSLPTEAEWECAARAGTTGDYAGNLDEMGWYDYHKSGGKTHPVATKQPNAWGIYDMHGNVWEWVHDWYGESYYGESRSVDPQGPSSGSFRVRRGGCYSSSAGACKSAFRHWCEQNFAFSGFRLRRTS